MGVRVSHNIGGLAADMSGIPVKVAVQSVEVVETNIHKGRDITQAIARRNSGRHGRLYPQAITSEMNGVIASPHGPGSLVSGEWGPDASKPQGNMEFERGSRNQPAHLDHQQGADIVTPWYVNDVDHMIDGLFW